jgi:hypothetical protein
MLPQIAAGITNGDSVMFTMASGLRGQAQREGSVPAKSVRLAALLGTLVLMSIAVNALAIFADGNARQRSSATADCSAITEKIDRLACYDKLAGRPASHPFRGANAPALDGSL